MTTDEQRAAEWEARIDIHDLVAKICTRLGIDASYVVRLDIRPDAVFAKLYLGRDGSCSGPKYIDKTTGYAAMEERQFEVRA